MGAAKELAERLNGSEYGHFHLPDTELNFAENYNLIVLYGSSDDCIEMEGIFTDEINYYSKEHRFTIDADGVVPEWDEDYEEQEAIDHIDRLRSPLGRVDVKVVSSYTAPYLAFHIGQGVGEAAFFELHHDGELHSHGAVLDISCWDKSDTLTVSAADEKIRSLQDEVRMRVARLPADMQRKVVRLVAELMQRVKAEPDLLNAIEFIGLEKGLYGPPNGAVQLG